MRFGWSVLLTLFAASGCNQNPPVKSATPVVKMSKLPPIGFSKDDIVSRFEQADVGRFRFKENIESDETTWNGQAQDRDASMVAFGPVEKLTGLELMVTIDQTSSEGDIRKLSVPFLALVKLVAPDWDPDEALVWFETAAPKARENHQAQVRKGNLMIMIFGNPINRLVTVRVMAAADKP